jgi:3-hydroxyisobutyrate dehydrogenase
LISHGAKWASTPQEAAAQADFAVAMLRDDDASRHVWLDKDTGALASIPKHAIAIDCSTITPGHAKLLAQRFQDIGVGFLDAPVAGSRPQAEAGQLMFFVGGNAETVAKAEPVLRIMGGAICHAGPAGAGATIKLAVNALLGIQVAAMAEVIGFLDKSGVDAAKAFEIIGASPVSSPASKGYGGLMISGNHPLLFPVELMQKDLAYMGDSASGGALPMANEALRVFSKASEAGLRDANASSVIKLYRQQSPPELELCLISVCPRVGVQCWP